MVLVHLILFTFMERHDRFLWPLRSLLFLVGTNNRVRVARVPGSVEYRILKISLNSSDMD